MSGIIDFIPSYIVVLLVFVLPINLLLVIIYLFSNNNTSPKDKRYYRGNKPYNQTDYYKMTNIPYYLLRRDKGRMGEYSTYCLLDKLEGYKKFLFNCYIPKEDGSTTEVDVIMIHETGIYVIESKNYNGWIFGREDAYEWTQTLPGRYKTAKKIHFYNPMKQNSTHIRWLKRYLIDIYRSKFFSYIVFGPNCELKSINQTTDEHRVVNRIYLLKDIRMIMVKNDVVLTNEEIDRIFERLYPLTKVDESVKKKHIEDIHKTMYKNEQENSVQSYEMNKVDKLICPRCGGELVLRIAKNGKYAGNRFYGCSRYPRCRFIVDIKTEDNKGSSRGISQKI